MREGGCLLQSIARRYYVIHATATYLADKFGIVPLRRRDSDRFETERFTHNELPDLVRVLYTGQRRGNIDPGNHAGIAGGILRDSEADLWVQRLQRDRTDADYGRREHVEPYDACAADERLHRADQVIADLNTLL